MDDSVHALRGLYAALALVALYFSRRVDERDRPYAVLVAYVAATDWLFVPLTALWAAATNSDVQWLRLVCLWPLDLFAVSWFAMHYVVAFRYRHGRWPRHLVAAGLALALLTGVLLIVYHLQLEFFGLEKGSTASVRGVVKYAVQVCFALMAVYQIVRMLQTGLVGPPHLLTFATVVNCCLQLVMALRPGARNRTLYEFGVLIYLVAALASYAWRLLHNKKRANTKKGQKNKELGSSTGVDEQTFI